MKEKARGISLYIHFPFCLRKCNYCDFVSFPLGIDQKNAYIKALKQEIEIFSVKFHNNQIHLSTIYFGGGTPSLLEPCEVEGILLHLSKYFDMSSLVEFTIEANPETVRFEKFRDFKSLGINRISLGAQSFNDRSLKVLGRIHNAKKIYSSFDILRKAGFKNINIDLMFSLPDEQMCELIFSLAEATNLFPEHISYYSLTVESGTPMLYISKQHKMPNEIESLAQYREGIKFLKEKGYIQYEVSNFARKGFQCVHNLSYWKSLPYIGFGVSAGSFLQRRRWKNVSSLESYIKRTDDGESVVSFREHLTGKKEKGEYFMMGLRLTSGIEIESYYDRFGVFPEADFEHEMDFLSHEGFIKRDNKRIRLTKKGLFVANRVLGFFI